MTAFEELHRKYTTGDRLSDRELEALSNSVSEFAATAREAEVIFGRGAVNYLTLLDSNLNQLVRDRRRLAEEKAETGPRMR